MHKHNFGQNLKLQSAVVTLNVNVNKILLTLFCPQQCICASLMEIHPVVQKIELKKG